MRECRPPAREPGRSWLARRSTMATSTPANANSPANISPVGPPPADHHRMFGHTPPPISKLKWGRRVPAPFRVASVASRLLEAVDAPFLLERLELGRPHEAETRRGSNVRVAVRGEPRISVLLALEQRPTGALVRLDDEAEVRGGDVRDVELPQDQVRRDRPRRIAWEGVGRARVHLVYPLSSEQSAGGSSSRA